MNDFSISVQVHKLLAANSYEDDVIIRSVVNRLQLNLNKHSIESIVYLTLTEIQSIIDILADKAQRKKMNAIEKANKETSTKNKISLYYAIGQDKKRNNSQGQQLSGLGIGSTNQHLGSLGMGSNIKGLSASKMNQSSVVNFLWTGSVQKISTMDSMCILVSIEQQGKNLLVKDESKGKTLYVYDMTDHNLEFEVVPESIFQRDFQILVKVSDKSKIYTFGTQNRKEFENWIEKILIEKETYAETSHFDSTLNNVES